MSREADVPLKDMNSEFSRVEAGVDKTQKWRSACMVLTVITFMVVLLGLLTVSFDTEEYSPLLFKHYITDESAVCNDGTRSIVYVRKVPSSRKWLLYVEGGFLYCWDQATCDNRYEKNPELMSSDFAPDTKDPTGLMSSDCNLNPDWCDANIGYIFYCSSDYFAGTVRATDPLSKTSFHFLGWPILQAAIQDLLHVHGMHDANTILYTGKGGGGVAALFSLDRVVDQIRNGLDDRLHCDIRSFTDSGWVSSRDPYTPRVCDDTNDAATCNIAGGVQRGINAWLPEYPEECHAAGYTWQCFFANYSFPYITTPSFVFTYQYDYAQLDTDGLISFHGSYNDKAGVAWAQEAAKNLVEKEIIGHRSVFFFLPGCWDHEIMDKSVLQDIYIGDYNLVDAMRTWYRGVHAIELYDSDFIMNSNPTCKNIR